MCYVIINGYNCYYYLFIILSIIFSLFVCNNLNKKDFIVDFKYSYEFVVIGLLISSIFPIIEIVLIGNKPSANIFSNGERWYGALFITFNYILIRFWNNIQLNNILSNICISVCLGIAIGKLGCFFSGHFGCYGISSNFSWSVIFNNINTNHSSFVAVHPIQLYDSIFHILLFFILYIVRNKFSWYYFLLFTSMYNFFIEFIRTNDKVIFNLSLAQIVYIFIVIEIQCLILFRKYKNKVNS